METEVQVQSELTRSKLYNPLKEDFEARYNGKALVIPAGKRVLMPTIAAKVVGRHLVTRCIEVLEFEGLTPRKGEVSQATVNKGVRAKYNEIVFGKGVDESGNPPALSDTEVVEEQVSVEEDSASEPVENWAMKTLVAKATELGVYDKSLKRPALEKAIKSVLESK